MIEICKFEIKNDAVYLNGEKLSEEETTRYLKNGLKYEGLRERLGQMGVSL